MVFQDIFDRTYIINLPERLDRRKEVIKELKGIGSYLVPGKVDFFSAVKPTDYQHFPSRGVLGCYLSHLAILKEARQEKLANVLLIEDDLAISKRFRLVSNELTDCLHQLEWDIIFLGFFPYHGLTLKHYYGLESETVYSSKSFAVKSTDKPTQGTHFYVVNKRIYDHLISFLDDLLERRLIDPDLKEIDSSRQLDGAYLDTAYFLFKQQNPEVKSFIICPNLGWQRNSRSDITLSAADKANGLELILNFYRAAKSVAKKNLEYFNPYWFSR